MDSDSANGFTSPEVEQLAIQLWIDWSNFQHGIRARIEWDMRGGTDGLIAMATEWAGQGQHQRNAWYAVAERARELLTPRPATPR